MTYARKTLVSLNDTPYYHVVARCVRRAWLWGIDEYAGRDYSHRKTWVLERLAELTSSFTIESSAHRDTHRFLACTINYLPAERSLERASTLVRISLRIGACPDHSAVVELQEELRKLERMQRQQIFQVEDEIEAKRDAFIDALQRRLNQQSRTVPLFRARWRLV